MSEDVARAVGAGQVEPITIAGKSINLRPLSIRELTELERECLSQYRRNFVRAYSELLDELDNEDDRQTILKEKIDVAARMTLSDLPAKYVYDPKSIKITEGLRAWVVLNVDGFDEEEKKAKNTEDLLRKVVVSNLDRGALSEDDYKAMTKASPKKVKVAFVNWWTSTLEGIFAMVFTLVKGQGITKDELNEEFITNPTLAIQVSRQIEHLTAPEMGNG